MVKLSNYYSQSIHSNIIHSNNYRQLFEILVRQIRYRQLVVCFHGNHVCTVDLLHFHRTHIYQQIKRDIVEGKLRCPLPFAPSIISYILQGRHSCSLCQYSCIGLYLGRRGMAAGWCKCT